MKACFIAKQRTIWVRRSSLSAELNSAGLSDATKTRGGLSACILALQFFNTAEGTVVNMHGREDEKALEKGVHGRGPRTSQQVLSCALAGEWKVRSLSMADFIL